MLGHRTRGYPTRAQALLGLILAVLAAPPAGAQDVELETIVVTALRRDESLQSVASSVSAVSGNFIDELGAREIREIMGLFPGLAIVSGWDTKYVLRGVSMDTWEEQRPATATYVDETPITNSASIVFTRDSSPYLIDMDRVEVLRGPQGTLFGSSSMGGAIRYITRRPSMSRSEGWIQVGATTTEHGSPGWSTSGMFNVPLQEGTLALRGVGYYEMLGGYIDNLSTGVDDVNEHRLYGGRLALQWQPNDRLTSVARIVYQRQDSDGTDQRDLDDPPYSQSRQTDESDREWRAVVSVDVDYDTSIARVHSTTSWMKNDINSPFDVSDWLELMVGLQNPVTMVNGQQTEDFVQEFRVESAEAGHWDWLAGLFYQHRDNVFTQSFPAPGFDEQTGGAAAEFDYPDNLYVTRMEQPVEEIAGYGEVGWRPAERWRVSAGARWFRFQREERERADGLLNGGPSDRRGRATETDVAPRFAVSYRPNDDRTYYAVASNGYRPGGPNLPPPAGLGCDADLAELGYDRPPLSFESDELWNYEIGARQSWRDGRLSLAGAVYRIDWSRIQYLIVLDCSWGFAQNAGDARNDGIELEVSYVPTAGVELRLAGSYVDAKIRQPALGTTTEAGDPLPGVPDLTGSLSAQWQFLNGPSFSASAHALWTYVAGRPTSPTDITIRSMDAYDTLDLRLQIDGYRWVAALSAENVFDDDGIVFVMDNLIARTVTTVRPRTLRLTLRYDF